MCHTVSAVCPSGGMCRPHFVRLPSSKKKASCREAFVITNIPIGAHTISSTHHIIITANLMNVILGCLDEIQWRARFNQISTIQCWAQKLPHQHGNEKWNWFSSLRENLSQCISPSNIGSPLDGDVSSRQTDYRAQLLGRTTPEIASLNFFSYLYTLLFWGRRRSTQKNTNWSWTFKISALFWRKKGM